MYKIIKPVLNPDGSVAIPEMVKRVGDSSFIPFSPDNTDYQTFKAQINADEAQLEDADGNLMTADEAKQFVSTLP